MLKDGKKVPIYKLVPSVKNIYITYNQ